MVATADPGILPEKATWYLDTNLPRLGSPREAGSPHPAASLWRSCADPGRRGPTAAWRPGGHPRTCSPAARRKRASPAPWEPVPSTASRVTGPKPASPPPPEAAILHPGAERKFYLRADVRAVSREQAEGMTEFDAVTVRGLRKRYGSGVVVDRLDFDVSRGEMVGVARDARRRCQEYDNRRVYSGAARPGEGALCVLGYAPVTGAAQVRPLIGGQLRDSALPDRLRVAGAVHLFATARARDGTELLEQSGLGERGRWGFSPFSGQERQRLFLVSRCPADRSGRHERGEKPGPARGGGSAGRRRQRGRGRDPGPGSAQTVRGCGGGARDRPDRPDG